MGAARAIPFDSIAPTGTANGGERRAMVHGTLATGETVELHQSMQTPGTPAPPLHVIQHSELIVVREGEGMFDHDGISEKAGPPDPSTRRLFIRIKSTTRFRTASPQVIGFWSFRKSQAVELWGRG